MIGGEALDDSNYDLWSMLTTQFNPVNLFAFMMGSTHYTVTLEDDWVIMVVMVLFLIFGPVLALNLLIALMADTYSGVQEEAEAEWAMKRAHHVLFRENWVWWTSPHFVPTGVTNIDEVATYDVQNVHPSKFKAQKKTNIPQQNYFMLKDM